MSDTTKIRLLGTGGYHVLCGIDTSVVLTAHKYITALGQYRGITIASSEVARACPEASRLAIANMGSFPFLKGEYEEVEE
jgi:hypothetical protein